MKKQTQLALDGYTSGNGFIHRYQQLIRDVVIPYQYEVLNDRVPGVEKSHVIANFANAGKALRGEDVGDGFYGMVFQDSDAAKWLEAVGCSLVNFPDKALEAKADALIKLIAGAQDADGYLNTYYTVKDQDKRWKNLLEGHELYCAGHMMEAAVAYYAATGKKTLLDVMERNAEHIYRHFIVEKHEGYPGHPEVELALLKLYRATGNPHCLELAKHFIDVRGVDPRYFEKEMASRDWKVWGADGSDRDYAQNGKPVREQSDATGHSVRAVYLYTAMADLAAETDDAELLEACDRLWQSATGKRMYVTGGIGSTAQGEAFTVDYDLPNDTVYAETCASIGLMLFASRMLENDANSRYADVMERAFYNTVLAGMQLDGKRFFYVNPLEVVPGVAGTAVTHRHVVPQRPSWYACACCPPNVARLISSIGVYAYGENASTAFCHLFAEGEARFANGMRLRCETEYPLGFTVRYTVEAGAGRLAVRLPDWSKHTALTRNGAPVEPAVREGYAYLDVKAGDTLELLLDGSVRRVYPSPLIADDSGCAALQRGPLVYCAEGVDNGGDVLALSLKENGEVAVKDGGAALPAGVTKIVAEGYRTEATDGLYAYASPKRVPASIEAIPYFTWGNRGLTQMRVWLPER